MAMDIVAMWKELDSALRAIDEKLDSRDSSPANQKSVVIENLIEQTQPNWSQVANGLIEQLQNVPEEDQIGFFYGIVRAFEKTYGDTARKLVDAKAENMPKPTPLISEDEVPAIQEQRKQVYGQIKVLFDMAKAFNDTDALDVMTAPRRRGGAPKGKRGPRAISFVKWNIDDKTYDTLKEVVEDLPQYDRVKDLADAMRAAKINLSDPPEEIDFVLPNGKTLHGVNTAKVNTSDDDDDDTGDDDDSE